MIFFRAIIGSDALQPDQCQAIESLPIPVSGKDGVVSSSVLRAISWSAIADSGVAPSSGGKRLFPCRVIILGGGHVGLPLLQSANHTYGWLANETFLAGYEHRTSLARSLPSLHFLARP